MTNPNPDEKLLDETEKKIVAAVIAGIELSHVQNVAPEKSAKLISNKIREIILSNFVSKDKVREALKDEVEFLHGDKKDIVDEAPARNRLRASLRSKLGIEDV